MCLVLLAYRTSEQAELVVGANRDEFFTRPSQTAHYWNDSPDIFAGRDLKALGTWLGVSKSGRFAALTNWTDLSVSSSTGRSRGELPGNFLKSDISALEFIEGINGADYSGFNLIVYDTEQLAYYSNRTNEKRILDAGVYGITNTRLGGEWKKAVVGSQMLAELGPCYEANAIVEMLQRNTTEDDFDSRIETTPERAESPCFILGDAYGTRASTAVIIGGSEITFREQSFGPRAKLGAVVHETIELTER